MKLTIPKALKYSLVIFLPIFVFLIFRWSSDKENHLQRHPSPQHLEMMRQVFSSGEVHPEVLEKLILEIPPEEAPQILLESFSIMKQSLDDYDWYLISQKYIDQMDSWNETQKLTFVRFVCNLQMSLDEDTGCNQLLDRFRFKGAWLTNNEYFKLVAHLNLKKAESFFEENIKDPQTGCSKKEFDPMAAISTSYMMQLKGDFPGALKCLSVIEIDNESSTDNPFYLLDKLRLAHLMDSNPYFLNKQLNEKIKRKHPLLEAHTSLISVADELKARNIPAAREKLVQALNLIKGNRLYYLESTAMYFLNNLDTPAENLPAPDNYLSWYAREILSKYN